MISCVQISRRVRLFIQISWICLSCKTKKLEKFRCSLARGMAVPRMASDNEFGKLTSLAENPFICHHYHLRPKRTQKPTEKFT